MKKRKIIKKKKSFIFNNLLKFLIILGIIILILFIILNYTYNKDIFFKNKGELKAIIVLPPWWPSNPPQPTPTPPVLLKCGNLVIDEGEECDPPNNIECNTNCRCNINPIKDSSSTFCKSDNMIYLYSKYHSYIYDSAQKKCVYYSSENTIPVIEMTTCEYCVIPAGSDKGSVKKYADGHSCTLENGITGKCQTGVCVLNPNLPPIYPA